MRRNYGLRLIERLLEGGEQQHGVFQSASPPVGEVCRARLIFQRVAVRETGARAAGRNSGTAIDTTGASLSMRSFVQSYLVRN
ncbi:hypothetical protein ACI2KE_05555 [Pseudomonas monteilii]|jgi:hypothetical protein